MYPGYTKGSKTFKAPSGKTVNLVDMDGSLSVLPLKLDEKNPTHYTANIFWDGVNYAIESTEGFMQHPEFIQINQKIFGKSDGHEDLDVFLKNYSMITARYFGVEGFEEKSIEYRVPRADYKLFNICQQNEKANGYMNKGIPINIIVLMGSRIRKITIKPGSDDWFHEYEKKYKTNESFLVRLREAAGDGFKAEKRAHAFALSDAEEIKDLLVKAGLKPDEVVFAGSLRRKKPVVGDLDIVLCSDKVDKAFYQKFVTELGSDFTDREVVKRLGNTLCSIRIGTFLIEFKKTVPELLGAMMLMATGSADFNTGMRAYCKKHGLSLSENGLKDSDGKVIASRTEKDIFDALGIPYVAPEDRSAFDIKPFKNTTHITHGKFASSPQRTLALKEPLYPPQMAFKIPPDVLDKLKSFDLPFKDENGVVIPRNFLYSKAARMAYYRARGKFKIPDELKLDRY